MQICVFRQLTFLRPIFTACLLDLVAVCARKTGLLVTALRAIGVPSAATTVFAGGRPMLHG